MSVYMDRSTGCWRYDFTQSGRRYTSRGFPDAETARSAERVRRANAARTNPPLWLDWIMAKWAGFQWADNEPELLVAVAATSARLNQSTTELDLDSCGFVYLVTAENGLTKIGMSRNPRSRIESLRGGSPCSIGVIHLIATNSRNHLENCLHEHFAGLRSHGEWFKLGRATLERLMMYHLVMYDAEGAYVGFRRHPIQIERDAVGPFVQCTPRRMVRHVA